MSHKLIHNHVKASSDKRQIKVQKKSVDKALYWMDNHSDKPLAYSKKDKIITKALTTAFDGVESNYDGKGTKEIDYKDFGKRVVLACSENGVTLRRIPKDVEDDVKDSFEGTSQKMSTSVLEQAWKTIGDGTKLPTSVKREILIDSIDEAIDDSAKTNSFNGVATFSHNSFGDKLRKNIDLANETDDYDDFISFDDSADYDGADEYEGTTANGGGLSEHDSLFGVAVGKKAKARVQKRKVVRLGRKAERQGLRQNRRKTRIASKQERKQMRAEGKAGRKNLRAENRSFRRGVKEDGVSGNTSFDPAGDTESAMNNQASNTSQSSRSSESTPTTESSTASEPMSSGGSSGGGGGGGAPEMSAQAEESSTEENPEEEKDGISELQATNDFDHLPAMLDEPFDGFLGIDESNKKTFITIGIIIAILIIGIYLYNKNK